jgi:lipase maturation factor 1
VLPLIGSRGLLPVAEFIATLSQRPETGLWSHPTLFWWTQSDAALRTGPWLGAGFALLAVFGLAPRLLLGLSGALYLSYVVVCRDFLSFQWDNLLLECVLLSFLARPHTKLPNAAPLESAVEHSFARWRIPEQRSAGQRVWAQVLTFIDQGRLGVFLFRVLLFKLYFESGLAKYQSHLGDWLDGSAMRFYYETAPLPAPFAFQAHALPAWWHQLESWATLCFELLCPFLIFGPRAVRLFTLVVFSAFQGFNILTANYGFFAYLALALGVYLLDERDATRLVQRWQSLLAAVGAGRLRAWWRWQRQHRGVALRTRGRQALLRLRARFPQVWLLNARRSLVTAACLGFLLLSFDQAVRRFADSAARLPLVTQLSEAIAPFRVVNTYQLFGHITRQRIEPEFQVLSGEQWLPQYLKYKPGPLDGELAFVAPHQPRLDFRLWFYGLSQQRGTPTYIVNLLRRLCQDPNAVAPFFAEPPPSAVAAARVAFWRYRFSSSAERASSGQLWQRSPLGSPRVLDCSTLDGR